MKKHLIIFSTILILLSACADQNDKTKLSLTGFIKKYDADGYVQLDNSGFQVSVIDSKIKSQTDIYGKFNLNHLESGYTIIEILDQELELPLYWRGPLIGDGEGFQIFYTYEKPNYILADSSIAFVSTEEYNYMEMRPLLKDADTDSLIEGVQVGMTVYLGYDSLVSNSNFFASNHFTVGSGNFGFSRNIYYPDNFDKNQVNSIYAVVYLTHKDEQFARFYHKDFKRTIRSSAIRSSTTFKIDLTQ